MLLLVLGYGLFCVSLRNPQSHRLISGFCVSSLLSAPQPNTLQNPILSTQLFSPLLLTPGPKQGLQCLDLQEASALAVLLLWSYLYTDVTKEPQSLLEIKVPICFLHTVQVHAKGCFKVLELSYDK